MRWVGAGERTPESPTRGRVGRSCVLHRDGDDDPVSVLVEDVDEQHRAPRAEDELEALPASGEFGTQPGELLQAFEDVPYTLPGVARQRVCSDERVQVSAGRSSQLDLRHVLQLVERDGVSRCGLRDAQLCAVEGTIDPVEQRGNVRRVGIEIIDAAAEQRPGERALVDVDTCGEPGELGGVLAVQGDVEPLATHAGRVDAATRYVHRHRLPEPRDNATAMREASRKTRSSIASVSRPVKVFAGG